MSLKIHIKYIWNKYHKVLKSLVFLYKEINAAEKQFLNRRYKFNQSFVVQYFPEEDKISNENMYFIAERMMRALEFIEQLEKKKQINLEGQTEVIE